MNERLLQYIWQFQYFNKCDLATFTGEKLSIIDAGTFNSNQGPDFLGARIKIGQNLWAGNVELHICVDDWYRHRHDHDVNYGNVILHVVWNDPGESEEPGIPTLVLNGRVSRLLMAQYLKWMESDKFIACETRLKEVHDLVWSKWKERLLFERLEKKSKLFKEWLISTNFHWEETLWWSISRCFGLTVNADAFTAVARSIPFNVLRRHQHDVYQVEALLLGQAGLLGNHLCDDYVRKLNKEYKFLKEKYSLRTISNTVHFLRMRPGSFPTIRLSQLAMLIHESGSRLVTLIDGGALSDLQQTLNTEASSYWNTHYLPGRLSEPLIKKTGSQLVNNILINSLIPFLFTFGDYHGEERYIDRAFEWMHKLLPEKNTITNKFRSIGMVSRNAADSQAQLEMKSSYCDEKRCLDCAIGVALLKST